MKRSFTVAAVAALPLAACGPALAQNPTPKAQPGKLGIANFEETADCKGNWISASVAADGTFTITNGRNGFTRSYAAH